MTLDPEFRKLLDAMLLEELEILPALQKKN
jgi:hypothetical protein